jgi:O-antigen/teichoic acid export membrane protein
MRLTDREFRRTVRVSFVGSDTGKAAGLAGASLANNAIQLIFTVVITRVLGADGYGALAALISTFLIMQVGGQSVQAAAARETAAATLGDASALRRTVAGWERTLLIAAAAVTLIGIAAHAPLASLTGTPEHAWAAAAVPLTGVMWILLSLQRGVLQGLHAFKPVGMSIIFEAVARLVLGIALGVSAGVTGAFLATALSFAVVSVGLAIELRRRLGTAEHGPGARTLRSLVSKGWVAVAGLVLLAVLQNVDVIVARHRLGHDRAGSYAVAAVAAKTVVWVAIGVGLQLLPQATVRAAQGLDPRPILWRALAVLGALAVPALLIFATVPKLLLRVGFGEDTTDAAPALIVLGLAMTMLAVAFLSVQFMIALGEVRFLGALLVIAATELVLLVTGPHSITGFADVVAGTQAVVAAAMLLLVWRAKPRVAPA